LPPKINKDLRTVSGADKKLNSGQEVKECDARKAEKSAKAGSKIINQQTETFL
jgi:hypothetical protein